jgi:hypothetical protein
VQRSETHGRGCLGRKAAIAAAPLRSSALQESPAAVRTARAAADPRSPRSRLLLFPSVALQVTAELSHERCSGIFSRRSAVHQPCKACIPLPCPELTVLWLGNVQLSIMANNSSNQESAKATLSGIKREMAKPRITKSARGLEPEQLKVFPLSGSGWPGLARPSRRPHRLVTYSSKIDPGAPST